MSTIPAVRSGQSEFCEGATSSEPGQISEGTASPWCMSYAKRLFDVACVLPTLILFSPGILMIAMAVRLTSHGPVLFRQERMGLRRRIFTVYKFRTMVHTPNAIGPGVTKACDPRLTPFGSFLRKHKLDEIPQLYNVLRGDMSLVGPRPKLAKFEHLGMNCRPGVTGAATLVFANEGEMLKEIPAEELDRFHQEVLSPIKKLLDQEYQQRATFWSDLGILFRTALKRPQYAALEEHLQLIANRQDLSAASTPSRDTEQRTPAQIGFTREGD